jgi:hypothetical protein
MIIFSSLWFLLKTSNQTEIKKKKTEPKPVQTDRFRFGFLGQKPIQTGLARFFRFGSVFSDLTQFFSLARFWLSFLPVWLSFFGLGSVRFFRF